jgi:formylglycine-generating enzyme required for sulfatase activity
MGRLYRTAYLTLLVAGPLCALSYFLIRLEGPVQQWVAANFMASVDRVLGAWGILPPFVSWGLLGFLVIGMIYFAIWEAHRIDIRKTRWFLFIFPGFLLAVGPIAWPFVDLYARTPCILYQRQPVAQPGEVSIAQGIEFVWIPPGRFWMGSPTRELGHEDDERLHIVTLRYGFWMSRYEITRAQWEAVMGLNPSRPPGKPDEPITGVLWQDCRDFLGNLNTVRDASFRLPTETEWEYACRALTTGTYSFEGDAAQLAEHGWFADNSERKARPVGQKTPNAWGLYDMHGNVWEWCEDWYGPYPTGRVIDPTGPVSGTYHVIRGGACDSPPEDCRSAARNFFMEGYFHDTHVLGFRVVRAPALRVRPINPLLRLPGIGGAQGATPLQPNANAPVPDAATVPPIPPVNRRHR